MPDPGGCCSFYRSSSDDQGYPAFGQVTQEQTVNEAVSGSGDLRSMPKTEQILIYAYDFMGRIEQVDTTIKEHVFGGSVLTQTYQQRTTYDEIGRVFQQFAPTLDPTDAPGELYVYNTQGFLAELREARFRLGNSVAYRSVQAINARGQVIQATLGNGTTIENQYDVVTGRPRQASETVPFRNELAVFYDYAWDQLGRLRIRNDFAANLRYEYYQYDARNRLTAYWHVDQSGHELPELLSPGAWTLQQHLRYDASGNMLCKSDVSGLSDCQGGDTYQYGANGAGLHAVTQVDLPNGHTRTFDYDQNGHMTEDRVNGSIERRFDYTPFNKVRRVAQKYIEVDQVYQQAEFHYGPNRGRFLQREVRGGGMHPLEVLSRTHYIGRVEFEYQGLGSFVIDQIRRDGGGLVLEDIGLDDRSHLRYQHRDHLGSIVALSKTNGEVHARMGFDPWGQRRDPVDAQAVWVQWLSAGASPFDLAPYWAQNMLDATPRGYTGHEHLDGHGVIHMNGRIYDPHLARFLQADPFMEDTGTLNRYTYVHNNPLIYTDPSGYFSLKKLGNAAMGWALGGPIGAVIGYHMDTQTLQTMLSIAMIAVAPHLSLGFWGSVALGAPSGAAATGSLEGALWGAFAAGAFYGVGQGLSGLEKGGLTFGERVTQAVAHGVTGGVIAEMQGGKFGHGFISAGVSKAATPAVMTYVHGPATQAVTLAIVGGTVSEVTGGKFANGRSPVR